MQKSIVIIEDEAPIRQLLTDVLTQASFQVHAFSLAEEALAYLISEEADLILLDIMLPHMDGLEACRRLKKSTLTGAIPVIMITARSDSEDVLKGFRLGADDYVTKPFDNEVLLARINAVLSRTGRDNKSVKEPNTTVEGLMIDEEKRMVIENGRSVDLSPAEFSMLLELYHAQGLPRSRGDLMKAAGSQVSSERNIDVQILSLRRKLGSSGRFIETVRGFGYRLVNYDLSR
jgi:two-component system alkaline phosphatase synthesis response regulator PhoP